MELMAEQIIEYLHKSYTGVDGLWFMKVEEKYGFETALEIDEAVWGVLPKLQARRLKSLVGDKTGLKALYECFRFKLIVDRFEFESQFDKDGRGFTITIGSCPWHKLLQKSKREHLSEKIGRRICTTEGKTWAGEFGANIKFELTSRICDDATYCVMRFTVQEDEKS